MKQLRLLFFIFTTWAVLLLIPSDVFAQTSSSSNPINWGTDFARLKSSNFYIKVGDQVFYGKEPIRIVSDPGVDLTTLEASWQENGREMRLYMYFKKNTDNSWELYDLRAYNGEPQGDWLYYTDSLGNPVNSIVGQHNYNDKRKFVSKSGNGEIICDSCSINAFMPKDIYTSPKGYALEPLVGLPTGEIITVNTSGGGYGVNVILKDKNGIVVKDQAGITYDWVSNNSNIANVVSDDITYYNGQCAYDMTPPCPNINGQISGISQGVTNITVSAIESASSEVLAKTTFPVKVVSFNNPNVTPSPESDEDQIEQLQEQINTLNTQVQEQQSAIQSLGSQLGALRELIANFFKGIFNW